MEQADIDATFLEHMLDMERIEASRDAKSELLRELLAWLNQRTAEQRAVAPNVIREELLRRLRVMQS